MKKTILIAAIAILATLIPTVFATTNGPNLPTIAVTSPSALNQWSDATNALTSDNQYAKGDNGDDQAFGGFNLNIPANSNILGIRVFVEGNVNTAGACTGGAGENYVDVTLSDQGVPSSLASFNSETKSSSDFGIADTVVTLGNVNNLWGLTWTAEELNNLYVLVTTRCGSQFNPLPNEFIRIDRVSVEVTYDLPDSDNDGVPDPIDNCPNNANANQANNDNDTLGDVCDTDDDNDTILDVNDDCVFLAEDFDQIQDNDGCPEIDADQDEINDEFDSCPTLAETYNDFNDEDGCPDELPPQDTDNDGILDESDLCPTEPENYNQFQDFDGCPDELPPVDTDEDGIVDELDQCPEQAENYNGFEDLNGCPDNLPEEPTDTDNDGILDFIDQCVTEPETYNGFEDADGCPDQVPEQEPEEQITESQSDGCRSWSYVNHATMAQMPTNIDFRRCGIIDDIPPEIVETVVSTNQVCVRARDNIGISRVISDIGVLEQHAGSYDWWCHPIDPNHMLVMYAAVDLAGNVSETVIVQVESINTSIVNPSIEASTNQDLNPHEGVEGIDLTSDQIIRQLRIGYSPEITSRAFHISDYALKEMLGKHTLVIDFKGQNAYTEYGKEIHGFIYVYGVNNGLLAKFAVSVTDDIHIKLAEEYIYSAYIVQ